MPIGLRTNYNHYDESIGLLHSLSYYLVDVEIKLYLESNAYLLIPLLAQDISSYAIDIIVHDTLNAFNLSVAYIPH